MLGTLVFVTKHRLFNLSKFEYCFIMSVPLFCLVSFGEDCPMFKSKMAVNV